MASSVPSASAFSLPLPSWQQPPSVRVTQYERKKRKRDLDNCGNETEDVGGETTDAASEFTPAPSSLILSPDEAHQYHIAGLPFDQELPGGRFPHAAPKDSALRRETKGDILKGLSTLSPPIYPPQSAGHQGNLRLQHFAVLSAILHRCLLRRDYLRAGRAWALILREEYGGNPVDIRNEGRWGIGAEILLRRGRQLSDLASSSEVEGESLKPKNTSGLCFTRKGFEDAKQYYERLIIQHPFRKAAPDATSALHFYPAMLGLWIYVTQEESNAARDALQRSSAEDSSDELSEDEDGFKTHHSSAKRKQRIIAEIREKELEQARHIAARMDEIIVSPPYSDSPELLELRGMVSLWIADLFVLSVPQPEDDYHTFDEVDAISADDFSGSIQERREQRLALEKRQAEILKSVGYFEKGKKRGKGVSHTLENLHIDDGISYMC